MKLGTLSPERANALVDELRAMANLPPGENAAALARAREIRFLLQGQAFATPTSNQKADAACRDLEVLLHAHRWREGGACGAALLTRLQLSFGVRRTNMHSFGGTLRTAAGVVVAGLALTPLRLNAQTPSLSDSVVVRFLSPALFGLLDYQMANAALGRRHVISVEVPDGPLWSRVAAHVLVAVKGRPPTSSDSSVTVVGIRDIRLVADTLIATVYQEIRERCPGARWVTTGTDYEVRTRRVGGGWTHITVTPGITWDAFGCP